MSDDEGFLEQVCTMDGVTFERMKGVMPRRYTAEIPRTMKVGGPMNLRRVSTCVKKMIYCKGAVRPKVLVK